MKNFTFLLALVAILAICLPCHAGEINEQDFNFRTTQDLGDLCSVDPASSSNIPAIYACRAFIEATVQYHDAVSDKKNLKRLICYGPEATIEDGRKVFVEWVATHKNDKNLMEEIPVVGMVRALAHKYPCPQ